MWALAISTMPAAAAMRIERQRRGDAVGDGAAGGVGVQRHLAAEEVRGVEAAEHQVGIGDGRRGAAAAVAGGAGAAPALRGPTRSAPPASIHASLPPPAPTSTRSITGVRTGIAAAFALAERGDGLGADLDLRREAELRRPG